MEEMKEIYKMRRANMKYQFAYMDKHMPYLSGTTEDDCQISGGTVIPSGGISADSSMVVVSINAEHFRPKFKAIIEDTIGWCNELYMLDQECQQRLEDALIQCLKDSDKV